MKNIFSKLNIKSSTSKMLFLSCFMLGLSIIFGVFVVVFGRGRDIFKAEFSPQGQTIRESIITVEFTKPVLKGKERDIINVPFTEQFIEFSPAIFGEYRWVSEKLLQFTPYEKLNADQTYTAKLPKNVYGRKLKGSKSFKFNTPPFRIENTSMYFDFYIFDVGKKNILMDISFNYDVDQEDIKRYVRLTRNGDDFPYEVVQGNSRVNYRLISGAIGKEHEDQNFKMYISKELPNIESGTTLKDDKHESLRLNKISDFEYKGYMSEQKGQENIVKLRFNKVVDPKFVNEYITIKYLGEENSQKFEFQSKVDTALIILTGKFKYNRQYSIKIDKGLRSIDGSVLKEVVTESLTIPKPDKSIKFLQPGSLLPVKDDVNIFVQSYDVAKLSLQAYRVSFGNIPFLLKNMSNDTFGKVVYNEDVKVDTKDEFSANITEINLKSFIEKYGKGMYRFQVRGDNGWPKADKWVLGTDLGLVVKNDSKNMIVFCASLTGFNPLKNVDVSILNYEGEELVTAKTDKDGFAVINDFTKSFNNNEPYMISAKYEDDYTYLLFKECKVNLTNFNIEGDPYRLGALEAFVYPSRDLFKPGEEIQLAAVVKKTGGGSLGDMPVSIKVFDPQSVPVFEENSALNTVGMCQYMFKLPSGVKTGKYLAALYVGEKLVIGQTSFVVEEFIPQSLKVEINVSSGTIRPGTNMNFEVRGRNLFGNAASGHRVAANVKFTYKPFRPYGYDDFKFDNSRFTYQTQDEILDETSLDEQGIIRYEMAISSKTVPYGMLNARIYAEVQQKAGRAVAMVKNVEISDKPYFLGLKRIQQAFSYLDKPSQFEIVALDRKGNPVNVDNIEIYIVKHGWYNIYQKPEWQKNGSYDSKEYQDIVLRKYIAKLKGKTLFSYKHETIGSYEIIAINKKDNISANLEYYVAGRGEVDMSLEKTEELQLRWGRDSYKIGEVAELSINSPIKGLLMLTIERDEVLYRKFIKIDNSAQVLKIPIKEEYLPNVYAIAMLFKTYNDKDSTLPLRAYGAIPLQLNQDSRRIKLEINVPDVINPNSSIDVEIKSDQALGETYLTLSTVEEGALDITDFHVPDIYGYFMRKRALTVQSYDTFSKVMGEIPNLHGNLTIGGGEYVPSDKHFNPIKFKKKKTVAFWSGIVKMKGGIAHIKVPVGSYNGSLRFMAVVCSNEMFGSKEISRNIFAPIILQPTVPLSIAPGDKLNVPISVYNKTGKTQTILLVAKTEGPMSIRGEKEKSFTLEHDKEGFADYRIEAEDTLGSASITFTAKAGTVDLSLEENLTIRPATIKEVINKSGVLKKDKNVRLTVDKEYYTEMQSGQLLVSPFAEAEKIGYLDYLIKYPYGCLEQKVSIAFPQLYIEDIAKTVTPFLYRTKKEKVYIEEAIKLAEMHFKPAGFELWNGYGGIPYLSIYSTHFLTEAKKYGYQIKDEVFEGALNNLKSFVQSGLRENLPDENLFNVCYSLYVLANGDRPLRESMEFVRNKLLKDQANVLSWVYLAAAYAKIGDQERAMDILEQKKELVFPENFTWWGNPYLTDTSAVAILIETLIEINPLHPGLDIYLDSLTQKLRYGQLINTHLSAMILRVYAKLFTSETGRTINAVAKYEGLEEIITGTQYLKKVKEFPSLEVSLENKGKDSLYYSFYSEAYPKRSDYRLSEDNGIKIKRELLNQEGKPLDLKNVLQGDIVVQKIEIEAAKAGNVVAVLLFPGGLEIENPRLKNVEGLNWIPNYDYHHSDYINILQDRILIFTDFSNSSGKRVYYFSFRAVFPGEFIVPYVFAEDMYRVDINGRTESSRLFIISKE